MKRGDILLGVIVLAIAAFFIVPKFTNNEAAPPGGNLYARVTVDGKLYQTVELTEEAADYDIVSAQGYNILKVHDFGVEMIDADCPDKVCLTFGFITKVGQSIVCLPHRVLVEIVDENGEGNGEVDAVVQ